MKLFFTPWLPPVVLTALVVLSLFVSLVFHPSSTESVFRLFYTIHFHVLACTAYVLSLWFILAERSGTRIIIATVNCSLSLVVWYGLVVMISSNLKLVA